MFWPARAAALGTRLLFHPGLEWLGACPTGDRGRDRAGSTLTAAAGALERAGAIRSADRFLFQARLFGGAASIKAGEYEVPARASHAQILGLLQSGTTLQRLIVVPEGLPSVLVHERLMRAPTLTGTVPVPPEGSVLPNSYAYQRGESRVAVLGYQDAMPGACSPLAPAIPACVAKRRGDLLASIV